MIKKFILNRSVLSLFVIYLSRLGVAALNLVIMPVFERMMSIGEFGLAATLISIQSLALALDLGIAISISREFPFFSRKDDFIKRLRGYEHWLVGLYLLIGLGLLLYIVCIDSDLGGALVVLAAFSVLICVLINISLTAIAARQSFISSSVGHLMAILSRHGMSLGLMWFGEPNFATFVLGQLLGGLIAFLFIRARVCRLSFEGVVVSRALSTQSFSRFALFIYAASGAIVMQADKIVISTNLSPSITGAYFLASMVALVPLTFFANPLMQFWQPKLLIALESGDGSLLLRVIQNFSLTIVALVIIPGCVLSVSFEYFSVFWLGDSSIRVDVADYVRILTPGVSMGSIGVVSYVYLLGHRDYSFLAFSSVLLTAINMVFVVYFVEVGDIRSVCITYCLYHLISAIVISLRAYFIYKKS